MFMDQDVLGSAGDVASALAPYNLEYRENFIFLSLTRKERWVAAWGRKVVSNCVGPMCRAVLK